MSTNIISIRQTVTVCYLFQLDVPRITDPHCLGRPVSTR